MALDLSEAGTAVMALVNLVQKGVDYAATLPPETDKTERDLLVAKVVLPEAIDLAIQIRRDVKD